MATPPGHSANSRGRLLIVDDDSLTRELLRDIAESDGYHVLTAEDGLEALDKLVEPLPDLIIADLRMPRMSGLELLKAVRRKFPDLRVMVISSEYGDGELPPEIATNAYLRKANFSPNQLRAKIRELLSPAPRDPQPGPVDASAT